MAQWHVPDHWLHSGTEWDILMIDVLHQMHIVTNYMPCVAVPIGKVTGAMTRASTRKDTINALHYAMLPAARCACAPPHSTRSSSCAAGP
jgi:hypothetical protein